MTEVNFSIPNISCKHCAHTIKTELSALAGIGQVDVDIESKKVRVMMDSPATIDQIVALLTEINYPPA